VSVDEKTHFRPVNPNGPEVVIALYRPKPGKGKELESIVARHMPALRELGLVTDRPSILMRAGDGTLIEVFEWRNVEAAGLAHEHPKIAQIWEAMGKISDYSALDSLPEAKRPFPHFVPVS
jgi:hypothetical protein